MNLEHVRNNWMKISKRVEYMDWGSSEVSVGGSNVGTEAVELFRSPHPTLRGRGARAEMDMPMLPKAEEKDPGKDAEKELPGRKKHK